MSSANEKRKTSRNETKARRAIMVCETYELKFTRNKFTSDDKTYFNNLFLDAKKLRNHMISNNEIFTFDTKIRAVPAFDKDKNEYIYTAKTISSQMAQDLQTVLISNVVGLSTKKKKGEKVGRIEPKGFCNSIPLKQINNTYHLDFENEKVRLQGNKKWFKVKGFKQFRKLHAKGVTVEYANAKLIRKEDDIYIHVTLFRSKTEEEIRLTERDDRTSCVGVDFGISSTITLSTGVKVSYDFDKQYEKLRAQNRKISKCVAKSRNREKERKKFRKMNRDLVNMKEDASRKSVSYLKKQHKTIAIQDENIKAWHKVRMRLLG